MPSAPTSCACGISLGSSILHCRVTRSPSRETAGTWRSRASWRSRRSSARRRRSRRAIVASPGLITSPPRTPSTATMSPERTAPARPDTPSTAGSPSERAMIAVCPSAPPSAAAKPPMRAGSMSAVSAGVISSAMMMVPEGTLENA